MGRFIAVLLACALGVEGAKRSGGRMGGSSMSRSRKSRTSTTRREATKTRETPTASAAAPAAPAGAAPTHTTVIMGGGGFGGGIGTGTLVGLSLMDSILAEQRRAAYMREQLETCVARCCSCNVCAGKRSLARTPAKWKCSRLSSKLRRRRSLRCRHRLRRRSRQRQVEAVCCPPMDSTLGHRACSVVVEICHTGFVRTSS